MVKSFYTGISYMVKGYMLAFSSTSENMPSKYVENLFLLMYVNQLISVNAIKY